jgi:hypothetical protein
MDGELVGADVLASCRTENGRSPFRSGQSRLFIDIDGNVPLRPARTQRFAGECGFQKQDWRSFTIDLKSSKANARPGRHPHA